MVLLLIASISILIVIYVVWSVLKAQFSVWKVLSKIYSTKETVSGINYRFCSIWVGPSNLAFYFHPIIQAGGVSICISMQGIQFKSLFLFHNLLLIPWKDIKEVSSTKSFKDIKEVSSTKSMNTFLKLITQLSSELSFLKVNGVPFPIYIYRPFTFHNDELPNELTRHWRTCNS